MRHHNPYIEKISTDLMCSYGCNQPAQYCFRNGKLCCSKHYNSCPAKRRHFSETQDHIANNRKSLETRTRLGITKSSQIKAGKTRRENGHYDRLAKKMKEHWAENPWDNNTHCPIIKYNDTEILYQGSHELAFLQSLEKEYGREWLIKNVNRGPSLWYIDNDGTERLYISDYIIGNTIYEIKSRYYWEQDKERNRCKLDACINQDYHVILVLDGEYINYDSISTLG